MQLTTKILLAMAIAIVLGSVTQELLEVLPETVGGYIQSILVDGIAFVGGKIFLASLKVLVVPLVFVFLVCGVCQLQGQTSLGWLSLKTMGLYLMTTAIAISLALFFAELVSPGSGISLAGISNYTAPEAKPFVQVIIDIFPTNPIQAMADGNMLQIIIFAILIGLAITQSGDAAPRLMKQFEDWNTMLLALVTMLMKFAPYGVFCLLYGLFAKQGLGIIGDLAVYMMVVVFVLFLHGLVVYPSLLKIFTGLNPRIFLAKLRETQLFAFSTSSSSATIPVTLKTVNQRLGVENRIASFSVPLGATINMDGTAIMQGVATAFIAQAYGLNLEFMDYLLVVLTATLASIGTAGVPGVGMITLAMVLQQAGLPVEGIALIIGVDRILDMTRTAVNVTGDAAVSCIVSDSVNALDHDVYNDPSKDGTN